jgi:myo-inositol-1(or 4)-monophosphatase
MERTRGSKVTDTHTDQLSQELLRLCKTLADTGGRKALAGRLAGLSQVETKSTSTDMVTEFDRATEKYIVDEIRRQRPKDSIIGEEGASVIGTSGVTWCIDPIDGTTNFLFALPLWSVSIGVSDKSGPLVGVVYIPALDEMFHAVRNQGAFLNDKQIFCNDISDISQALVCTGFSYLPENRTIQSRRVAKFIDQVRDIRRFGAASIDICFVACGRLDAYFEENLYQWDIAAAELIAIESGARTGNFSGGSSTPKEFMVTCPAMFDKLSKLVIASSVSD